MFTDPRNKIPPAVQPVVLIFSIILIAVCVTANAGGEINPARDLGPKLVAFTVGYGWDVFSYLFIFTFISVTEIISGFLIPIFVPFAGAAFGAWFYHLSLGIHISDDKDHCKTDDRMEMNEVSRVTIGKSRIAIAK
ncbi:hypothetical protein WUBG_14388 [Wuchereria bancrofti]|uniref:Aquaporin n=1 Tax=Wuchereria bancrofti TaxID=6293 RepID=J9EH23_WUCBA|nr:hypothetical protein WUBG_14388 [Wuchereria bancrofti]